MRTKRTTKALIATVMSSGLVAAAITAASPDLYHDTNNPSSVTTVVTGSVTTSIGHTDLYHDT
jgi:hypothetical protein